MTTAVLLLFLIARCSISRTLSYKLSYIRMRTAANGTKPNESDANMDPNGETNITIRGPPVVT